MTCVVCGGAVTEAVFSNPWEKTRKVSACCSAACAQKFDPDQHWIPSQRPVPIDTMEEARLVRIAGERLRKGDKPLVVTRELLLAGVGIAALRKLLSSTKLGSESTDAAALRPPVQTRGWLGALVYGASKLAAPDADPDLVTAALADLDRWTKHFA